MSTECKHCGNELIPGNIKCPVCSRYNVAPHRNREAVFMSLSDAPPVEKNRLCRKAWWAHIFGGGFVYRQCLLVGGQAGCGKSTWALQVGEWVYRETKLPTLYLASEEAPEDIRERADRMGVDTDAFIIPVVQPDQMLACLEEEEEFGLVIADSIPDFTGHNPNEAVDLLKRLKDYSKERGTPTFCIDHVNKGEELAGLERMKHVVDTTVLIEGTVDEPDYQMRVMKNRFGQGNKVMRLIMRGEDDENPGTVHPNEEDLEKYKKEAAKREARKAAAKARKKGHVTAVKVLRTSKKNSTRKRK